MTRRAEKVEGDGLWFHTLRPIQGVSINWKRARVLR